MHGCLTCRPKKIKKILVGHNLYHSGRRWKKNVEKMRKNAGRMRKNVVLIFGTKKNRWIVLTMVREWAKKITKPKPRQIHPIMAHSHKNWSK